MNTFYTQKPMRAAELSEQFDLRQLLAGKAFSVSGEMPEGEYAWKIGRFDDPIYQLETSNPIADFFKKMLVDQHYGNTINGMTRDQMNCYGAYLFRKNGDALEQLMLHYSRNDDLFAFEHPDHCRWIEDDYADTDIQIDGYVSSLNCEIEIDARTQDATAYTNYLLKYFDEFMWVDGERPRVPEFTHVCDSSDLTFEKLSGDLSSKPVDSALLEMKGAVLLVRKSGEEWKATILCVSPTIECARWELTDMRFNSNTGAF